ncbi:MAG: peptidoglycan-binding protein [Paracoccaceae bacterium]|nr:MAG: peptidoglycan-binding protein [Paracoccaceae bacterium]
MTQSPDFRLRPALSIALLLAACAGGPLPAPPSSADLTAALIPRTGPTPPETPAGACWAGDVTPAVIETVTEQVQASAERRAPDGSLIAPSTFRTETRQRIVSDRREVWFETLCEDELTVDLVSTLQRALKARGLYLLPLSGQMDGPTRSAILAWQRPRGLDSDILSREAARALGIVAVPRE